MPLYEYDCPGCAQPFEKRVSMSDADSVECPNCGSKHPKRRLSRISVRGQSQASAASSSGAVPVSGGL